MAVSGLRRFYGLSKITSTTNASSFKYSHRRALSDLKKNIYDDDSSLPVLIVGVGPVGLVLSILLTNLGVKCSILEKNTTFSRHPQAHLINHRSMEVFRKLDGWADDIMNSQPPVDYWRKFIYCTSLTGQILGSVDHMQPQGRIMFDRVKCRS